MPFVTCRGCVDELVNAGYCPWTVESDGDQNDERWHCGKKPVKSLKSQKPCMKEEAKMCPLLIVELRLERE